MIVLEIFQDLCRRSSATAKLVADAQHAAVAVEHGCAAVHDHGQPALVRDAHGLGGDHALGFPERIKNPHQRLALTGEIIEHEKLITGIIAGAEHGLVFGLVLNQLELR